MGQPMPQPGAYYAPASGLCHGLRPQGHKTVQYGTRHLACASSDIPIQVYDMDGTASPRSSPT